MQRTLDKGAPPVSRITAASRPEPHGGMFFYDSAFDDSPEGIIRTMSEDHHRTKFYATVSGGKDSIGVAHYLDTMGLLESVVHVRTGIGFTATTEFVKDYCKEMKWPLEIIEPKPKYTYASLCLEYGFPGPGSHKAVMGVLKFAPMRDFIKRRGQNKTHVMVSGVRRWESDRRKYNYPRPIVHNSSLWFACPFFFKTDEEVYKYKVEHGLKTTPIHDRIGMSGECMCGAFASRHEKLMIPDIETRLADYIAWIEDGIQRFGSDRAKRYPTWGSGPSIDSQEGQKFMEDFLAENPELAEDVEMEQAMCGVECGAGTMKGALNY